MLRSTIIALALIPTAVRGDDATRVDFARQVRPILSDTCFACHGPDESQRQADLRLDIKAEVFAEREEQGGQKGLTAIKPKDLQGSAVWKRITSNDPDTQMPPTDSPKRLTAEQVEVLRRWIEQGAEWTDHWAFNNPIQPPLPSVSHDAWPRNAIDHFVLARLDREGLKPSPAADRPTLIRRLGLDLTGLPPTPEDVARFVNDDSPDAYETLVDRLLASPHYGERMAVMWLDAARYGDTSVFHADGHRDMWPWRDWVIRSYNDNMPFDTFSVNQLAGDLLKDSTATQQMASGFLRNNATTDEGGAIAEEFRVEYAVDRVRTTSVVWLGLSLECAQCHDHKFDPITQREYYRFFAYFNQASDPGMQTRNGNQAPVVDVFDPGRARQADDVAARLTKFETALQERAAAVDGEFHDWLANASRTPDDVELSLTPRDAVVQLALDEEKGKSTKDAAKEGRKGQVKGKPKWVEGKLGRAFQFDGSNHIDLGLAADFDRLDAFSFGCWLKPAGTVSGSPMGRMVEEQNIRGFCIDMSAGTVQIFLNHEWPTNAILVTLKDKLVANEWQHLFVTYDGSSQAKGVAVYVNGQPAGTNIVYDGLTRSIRTRAPLLIGRRFTGGKGSPFQGTIDDVRVYARRLSAADVQALAGADPITPLLKLANRSDEQTQILKEYYLSRHDATYGGLQSRIRDDRQKMANLRQRVSTVMVMKDVESPRKTFVLNRGSYDQPSNEHVEPGTPAALPPMQADAPKSRVGLARWLFDEDHPLTARVAVNRYWQMLFGVGLVETAEDFGSQGAFPTHPQLLDWLATDFRQNGWNVKRVIKQIVMSSTYRQSSHVPAELLARDPNNRLLARGARFRLQGEFVRDSALAISGLLVARLGGAGVKPYQPAGLWTEVALGGHPKFVQDHGDALYRRSLYTYWKRSSPPPSMQIFDAPTRERCVVRRGRTNTPLQALVTLNDVQFVEAARNFAERILTQGGATTEERLHFAYRVALSRSARPLDIETLTKILTSAQARFQSEPESAEELLSFGESDRNDRLQASEHAAWTIVASVILNLDELLTRG